MNELYTQTELIRGRMYRYDPDRDIWYPMAAQETALSQWAWAFVSVLLAAIVYLIEYYK